jgi:hypothetical protein
VCEEAVESIRAEFCAMLRYALGQGLPVPSDAMAAAAPDSDLARLDAAHSDLARVVLPATPASILLLDEERPRKAIHRLLGPIRLVRQLMAFALVQLVAFIVLAIWTTDIPDFEVAGKPAILGTLYLVCSAGLDAAFAALFRANRYVATGTFERRYEASYWILIVLGLIAGLVLSLVIPVGMRA